MLSHRIHTYLTCPWTEPCYKTQSCFHFLSVLLWLQLQQTSIAVPTCSTYLHRAFISLPIPLSHPSTCYCGQTYVGPFVRIGTLSFSLQDGPSPADWQYWHTYILEHSHAGSSDGGMKVIRHAGVDSRMIILDNQARQQMTHHFQLSQSCRIKWWYLPIAKWWCHFKGTADAVAEYCSAVSCPNAPNTF